MKKQDDLLFEAVLEEAADRYIRGFPWEMAERMACDTLQVELAKYLAWKAANRGEKA